MNDEREGDGAAHFEGLRAWLNEVDRTIRIRSHVGLALLAIAIAGAGAALYLGIATSRHSAGAGEVQGLQGQVDALRGQVARAVQLRGHVAAAQSQARRANAEIAKLQSQVQGLEEKTAAKIEHEPSRGVASTAGDKAPVASANGSEAPAAGAGKSSGGEATIVSTAANSKLGEIIVNSHGLTLYDFHKDTGAKSACYGPCASVWPPLTTRGAPEAMGGAEAPKLATARRTDGTTQVTYGGRPLYTYAGDGKPGEATGNGITEFGGSWNALHPTGTDAGG